VVDDVLTGRPAAPLRLGPQDVWGRGIFGDGLRRGHEADIYGIESAGPPCGRGFD
jgi:hypothetical protein